MIASSGVSRRCSGLACAGLFALCLLLEGCGSVSQTPQPNVERHMQKAVRLYNMYVDAKKQPPKNDEEFMAFLKTLTPKQLEEEGITNVEDALKSPRDGERYVFLFGTTGSYMGGGRVSKDSKAQGAYRRPILLYERKGSGGKHYVAYMMGGGYEEVTAEQLKEMVPQ